MKVDKLFAVLVLGGGVMAGCGGQPQAKPEAPGGESSANDTADERPADETPASQPEAGDGEAGKCAWF